MFSFIIMFVPCLRNIFWYKQLTFYVTIIHIPFEVKLRSINSPFHLFWTFPQDGSSLDEDIEDLSGGHDAQAIPPHPATAEHHSLAIQREMQRVLVFSKFNPFASQDSSLNIEFPYKYPPFHPKPSLAMMSASLCSHQDTNCYLDPLLPTSCSKEPSGHSVLLCSSVPP